MFWKIMLAVDLIGYAVFLAVAFRGSRWGVADQTVRRVRSSSWLLLGWAAVSAANIARGN